MLNLRALIFVALTALLPSPLSAAQFFHYQKNISVDYDETKWKPVEGKSGAWTENKGETLLTLERILPSKSNKEYRPRFSVVSEAVNAQTTASDVHKRAISFLEGFRFRVWGKNVKHYSGIHTPVLEITADQRDFGLTLRQAIVMEGKHVFYLTAATRLNQFDAQKEEIQKFFASFRIGTN